MSTATPTTISRHEIVFGRVSEPDQPTRTARVEIELTADRLSISGAVASTREHNRRDAIMAGQIAGSLLAMLDAGDLEPVAPFNEDRARRLLAIWDRWHLNDMRAGCSHQRTGIAADDNDPSAGVPWDERPIDPAKPTNTYGRHFDGQQQDSWNMLGWVRRDEHPAGLLAHPCPECGYKYGTAWRTEEIPAEIRDELVALIA